MEIQFRRLAAVSILGTAIALSNAEAQFSGRATAVDGDDIKLCSEADACRRIRLCGIDAPERRCPGFDEARAALQAFVKGKEVLCIQVGGGTPCDGKSPPKSRDRIVAQCSVDGRDVAAALVEAGFACDWEKFSGGHYSGNGKGRACPPNHRRTCAAVAPRP